MDQKKLFLFADEEEKLKGYIGTLQGKNQRILYVKYVYILHVIIYKYTNSYKEYLAHGAPINIQDLQNKFGGPCADVTSIIRNLEAWGYVKLKHGYQASKRAKTYQLSQKYENQKLTMDWFTPKDGKFIQKLLDGNKEQINDPLIGLVLTIFDTKVSLSENGLAFIQSKYNVPEMVKIIEWHRDGTIKERLNEVKIMVKSFKIDRTDFVLLSFLLKDFYVSLPKKTRRMFTNLTNLNRQYRQYVLLNGKPLLETDIVNSQPTFSIPLINQTLQSMIGNDKATTDMELYESLATSGKFYEALAAEAGMNISSEDARKNFKREFYEQVFFSKVYNSNNKIKVAFISLFPSAYAAIKNIKKDGYAKFAIQLQNLEAELMIYEVLSQMINEGHDVLSIHDSLVVNNKESLQYAEFLIQERFQTKYQLKIAFKSKKLNQDPETFITPVNKVVELNLTQNELSQQSVKPIIFKFPDCITRTVAFEFFELKHLQYINLKLNSSCIDNYLYNSFLNKKDLSQTQIDCLKLYVEEFVANKVNVLAA